MKPFMYHRQGLAQKYCQGLMGGVFRDYRSGLFLAAPRRTGKTTFLREDLLPTLEQNGFLPVYADLWADMTRNPSEVISEAIQEKLRAFSDFFEKIGAENFTFHGLEFNLKAPTLSPDITLGTALRTLTEVAKKPIALVVDEAQHALSTGKGTNAMFALKSARDTLNGAGQPTKLAVVFTGSNRDKLASLTLDHKQPFYGVTVQRFPTLDKYFAKDFAEYVNSELKDQQLDPEIVFEAFSMVGFRPEKLREAVNNALDECEISMDKNLNNEVLITARITKAQIENQLLVDLAKVTDIQRAVFKVLVLHHSSFEPYSERAMVEYKAEMGKAPGISTVQKALEALRVKSFVWKESFGTYVVENENYLAYYGVNNATELQPGASV